MERNAVVVSPENQLVMEINNDSGHDGENLIELFDKVSKIVGYSKVHRSIETEFGILSMIVIFKPGNKVYTAMMDDKKFGRFICGGPTMSDAVRQILINVKTRIKNKCKMKPPVKQQKKVAISGTLDDVLKVASQ